MKLVWYRGLKGRIVTRDHHGGGLIKITQRSSVLYGDYIRIRKLYNLKQRSR